MSSKKIISAAIVSGLAVSSAEAAHDLSDPANARPQIQSKSEHVDSAEPLDVLSYDWDAEFGGPEIPSYFESEADRGDLVVAAAGELDALFGIGPQDGEEQFGIVGQEDPDLILSTDAEPDLDDGDLYLAQTVYGGTGNDGLVGTRERGGKTLRGGSKLKTLTKPKTGTGTKLRTGTGVTKPRVGNDLKRTTKPGGKLKKP